MIDITGKGGPPSVDPEITRDHTESHDRGPVTPQLRCLVITINAWTRGWPSLRAFFYSLNTSCSYSLQSLLWFNFLYVKKCIENHIYKIVCVLNAFEKSDMVHMHNLIILQFELYTHIIHQNIIGVMSNCFMHVSNWWQLFIVAKWPQYMLNISFSFKIDKSMSMKRGYSRASQNSLDKMKNGTGGNSSPGTDDER